MREEAIDQILARLKRADHVLALSHIRPDGDAVGSLLAFGLSLQAGGTRVQMVLADGIPENLRHLPGADRVRTDPEGSPDTIVTLDSSDLSRLGGAMEGLGRPDINIDHHVTNERYAHVNLVDTDAVATAEILARYLPRWGYPIDADVAANLVTALLTDTLGFRTSNMTPEALRITADLMAYGIDMPALYRRALLQHPFESGRYWGAGLSRLQRRGGIVWTTLLQSDRERSGYPSPDDADLINFLSSMREIDMAVVFVEQPSGSIKVSWRARPGIDVSSVAAQFGGGGHPAAAGAELDADLQTAQTEVLRTTEAALAASRRPTQV